MMGGKEQSGQEDVIMEEKGEENKAASGTEGLMVPRRGSRRAGTRSPASQSICSAHGTGTADRSFGLYKCQAALFPSLI